MKRLEIFVWCLLAVYLVATFCVVESREPVWVDEMYVQSTAWSILHNGPAGMSVDGLYPENISVLRFFGPVSFRAGTAWMSVFGLSVLPWRSLCFLLGISFMAVSAAFLLRQCGATRWSALGGAAAILVSTPYGILLPGRWDPITAGLILSGVAVLISASKAPSNRLIWQALAAGILFALALGSTPRALPPLASLACGWLVAAYATPTSRARFLWAGIAAAFSTFAAHAALLAPLGMTPWSWLQLVRNASRGDRIDCSPVLGGTWDPGIATHKVVALFAVILTLSALLAAAGQHPKESRSSNAGRLVLTVMAAVNLATSVLLLSRFLGYSIFWLPFLAAASFSWIRWESLRRSRARILAGTLVCLEFLLPVGAEIPRMIKAVNLWKGRDPLILLTGIREHIPPGSIVFSQTARYYFAVEQSGSRYLYLANDITPGLARGDNSAEYHERALDAAACTAPTFAVWPRDPSEYPLPEEIVRHQKVLVYTAEGDAREAPVIYRLSAPANCLLNQFDTTRIRPY